MAHIINTPSGNIGRVLTRFLLDEKADVIIISRHPEKVADQVAQGARLVTGSIDTPQTLQSALQDGATLFWLTPPNLVPGYPQWATKAASLAADLANEHGVDHIVVLSSTGAQTGPGTGPVAVLREVEDIFRAKCANVALLRPAYFMENLLFHTAAIAASGAFYLPLPADRSMPMVATRDIANVAAGLMLDSSWSGNRFVGVHGPEDLSHARAAAIISAELGRTVTYAEVTPQQSREAMQQMGMSDYEIDMYSELYAAMADGRLDPAEPRTAETTTTTTLAQFVREVMKPAMGQAAGA
jgi:uncharacterized protein YbjT (DUF2867 family)